MKTFEYSITPEATAKDGMATVSSICGYMVNAAFRTLSDEGYGMCLLSRCSIEIDERPKCGEMVNIRVDSGLNNIVTLLNRNVSLTDSEGHEIGRCKVEWIFPSAAQKIEIAENPSRLARRFINKFKDAMPDVESAMGLQLRIDMDFREKAIERQDFSVDFKKICDSSFFFLARSGSDTLYVPATQLDMVSKYIGGGEESNERTRLSKLGGTEWAKAKSRAKKATKELAKGLIQLYAQRQRQPGYAFHPDDPWQKEFEDKFEYQETEDQLRCVQEIKGDMERNIPMDRLLCGDVGYGKTEVALRAVMKCVLEGKQAAILAPTTVLANQHYQTAVQRFQGFPVKIAVVSRFQTPVQMKRILGDLEKGLVDVLIGTHRLFSKDIQFKDLGLLVVDEEQRFGVSQKEKLKELFKQVDVLTLSATPIPRTMNMALSGIRDMSTLEEPPLDRQPVQTYVLEHNWSMLADAMAREIGRGGQVYYLHNRVESIAATALRIQEMLGEDVKVAYAHGKMTEEQLNAVMAKVIDGEIQVLVCTTIIETGIDIPNVNTLIIEDADKMGLAQLHQIRGRVGRSSRRAFAYLTYRRGKELSEVAAKRLSAVREFAEFGAGFKIAMRDLEIRGAGNLLGAEQSGFMMTVGYDMYLKLLEEAVLEEKGETAIRTEEVTADLTISANIPEYYISSAEQRMDLYRRIARIRTDEDADDMVDELIDRYGEPPKAVNNLISIALLRSAASDVGFTEVNQKGNVVNFIFREADLPGVARLCGEPIFKGRLLFSPGEKITLSLRLRPGENVLAWSERLVKEYAKIRQKTKETEEGGTGL